MICRSCSADCSAALSTASNAGNRVCSIALDTLRLRVVVIVVVFAPIVVRKPSRSLCMKSLAKDCGQKKRRNETANDERNGQLTKSSPHRLHDLLYCGWPAMYALYWRLVFNLESLGYAVSERVRGGYDASEKRSNNRRRRWARYESSLPTVGREAVIA